MNGFNPLQPQLAVVPTFGYKPFYRTSPWIPTPSIEEIFGSFDERALKELKRVLQKGKSLKDRILMMSGSQANYLTTSLNNLVWGKTAYAGETTYYAGLWAAALDDTFTGATSSESAYTSYARLSLTNNTTIFAAGSGTTTRTNTFPSDATKSFATSTGIGTNNTITYLGILNGNAGSSSDKGIIWCSVTSTTINNGDTPQLAQNAISYVAD